MYMRKADCIVPYFSTLQQLQTFYNMQLVAFCCIPTLKDRGYMYMYTVLPMFLSRTIFFFRYQLRNTIQGRTILKNNETPGKDQLSAEHLKQINI